MKKIFSAFVAVILLAPMFAMADDGPSPETCLPVTCKAVDTSTSVSLDASLQKDYILGSHDSLGVGNWHKSNFRDERSKYSEKIEIGDYLQQGIINSNQYAAVPSEPQDFDGYAILDKEYF